jgi:hypothetical protein
VSEDGLLSAFRSFVNIILNIATVEASLQQVISFMSSSEISIFVIGDD